MLIGEATKFGGGLFLWGDYWDLNSLRETIHKIVGDDPEPMGTTVLGLAYEVRKSLERKRDEGTFGHDEYDRVVYRGAKLSWPSVLFQVAVLRSTAAVAVLTKEDQANLFRLEHCVEEALRQLSPSVAADCERWIPYLAPRSSDI